MIGKIAGWMNGWKNEWMGGWIDGWTEWIYIYRFRDGLILENALK